jgi:hypothetical protein
VAYHCPPLAVRMLRALSSRAIPVQCLGAGCADILAHWQNLGSVAICARPAPTAATLPLPACRDAAAPLTLPSRLLRALTAASAAMVRALIILRSC